MSEVEQSIQLQIQDIAAVKKTFLESLAKRQPDTLWWLVDSSEGIAYENRVKGSTILAMDQSIDNVNIGSFFADWFNLHNAYFSQDNPFSTMTPPPSPPVQTLQAAVLQIYRWRVPQYFNDIAAGGAGQAFSPLTVFPHEDMNLGTYAVTGTLFTKGVGPVDPTVCGPGILSVASYLKPITATISLSITATYSDGTSTAPPLAVTVPVPAAPPADQFAPTPVGGQQLTAPYVAATGGGIVTVGATTGFKVGTGGVANLVVITEEDVVGSPAALPSGKSEVAELAAMTGTTLTLRQLTPATSFGGTPTPYPNGLRNSYTTAATVYPLFNDVTAVVGTTGTAGDEVQISFYPDWPQGFVDITSISFPQTMGGLSKDVVEEKDTPSADQPQKPVSAPPKPQKPAPPETHPSDAPKKAPV